jgi:hypothetical protein
VPSNRRRSAFRGSVCSAAKPSGSWKLINCREPCGRLMILHTTTSACAQEDVTGSIRPLASESEDEDSPSRDRGWFTHCCFVKVPVKSGKRFGRRSAALIARHHCSLGGSAFVQIVNPDANM